MDQLGLDFARTHARRTDPQTSKLAAASVMESARAQRERIYWSLLRYGAPLNADEIAEREGMTMEQVCRRLPELADPKKDGRIERLEAKRPTRRGCPAHLYRVRPTLEATQTGRVG